jgi:hypothetical protein
MQWTKDRKEVLSRVDPLLRRALIHNLAKKQMPSITLLTSVRAPHSGGIVTKRDKRIPNPEYRGRMVAWKLLIDKPNFDRTDATLEIRFAIPGSKHSFALSIPCLVLYGKVIPIKRGIATHFDKAECKVMRKTEFSVVDIQDNKWRTVLNGVIEVVAADASKRPIKKGDSKVYSGDLILSPELFGIKKQITMCGVSSEELIEAGQLEEK